MNGMQAITLEVIDNIATALREFFVAEGCAFTEAQESALARAQDVSTWQTREDVERVKAAA